MSALEAANNCAYVLSVVLESSLVLLVPLAGGLVVVMAVAVAYERWQGGAS